MALGPRLDLRQSQSLVMTPQLQQAIRLLALSNLELEAFIGEALEANPLLEMGEVSRDEAPDAPIEAMPQEAGADSAGEGDAALDIDPSALDRDRDTGDADWSAAPSSGAGEDGPSIDERGTADGPSLPEHLHAQVGIVARDRREEFIARALIDQLDEAGYLSLSVGEVAQALGVPTAEVERALTVVQSLDPTGVGARSLAECIALQAREADRYDPCMARLIDNLDLVARGEVARLKRMCEVDDEDFAEMLAELRGYDPKPGLRFGSSGEAAVVPDILLVPSGMGWDITLNEATLPRLIVNRSYYAQLRDGAAGDKAANAWLRDQLAEANWLLKALDQRARTILRVAAEIVKRQDGFFRKGVSELKPLTLRAVAEEIELHESTVSRVTSNKYLACPRGTFELKYFFTSGVASADGEGASAEAVKSAIRQLIEAEDPGAILSDDTLVDLLKAKGFDLARRTVAKYREAMGIGSSVQRRRAKKLAGIGQP
ncbi:RNA polymerase sigma-54 factor 1 [Tsuneonella dongtanensis]|uniref:RNA polymerase sigma-54 factor n=1 Tax=Tsuneonella dongtanensis TaxID=692370 RepID=A0A1B2A9B7_9SPHN|nr:RNA polymerase factor sigma-54 [Tsuneonella dongtanensis]ANY18746.1 RNA polymerase sigma-54 factor 1 [Tsuneonella dongtanensis]